MTSNSSIYKFTKEHLRHSGWMIILSVIGHLLAGPILFLFADTADPEYVNTLWTETQILQRRLARIQNILISGNLTAYLMIAMLGAAIVAFGTFYYLFQSSKIDLYHSLPLTRRELFTAGYLNGIIIWFVPFIISNLVTLIIACVKMNHLASLCPIIFADLKILGIVFLSFIIIYHLCLVGIMLCGNLMNALICSGLYGIGVISIYGLFIAMFSMYFDTFHSFSISPQQIAFLSPIAAPVVMVMELGTAFEAWKLILYVGSILLAFANICIATQLHKHRNSELAGNGISCKTIALIIRGFLGLIGGLLGICFVQALGYGDLSLVWDFVFGLLAALFVYGVCIAIQKKSVRAIWKHKLELLVTAAVTCVIILFFHFDFMGYDTYLPRQDNIESMQIRISGLGNRYYDYSSDTYSDFSSYVCEDSEVIYHLLDTAIMDTHKTQHTDYRGNYNSITVHVTPKIGLPYYRYYYICEDSIDALRPIAEDLDYIRSSYTYLYDAALRFEEANIYGINRTGTAIEDQKTITKLRNALIKDMEEHSTVEEQSTYLYVADLSFSFKRAGSDYYSSRSFSIPNFYENTLQAMSEAMDGFTYTLAPEDITSYSLEVWYPDTMTLTEYLSMELLYTDRTALYGEVATTELHEKYSAGEDFLHRFSVSGDDLAVILKYATPADGYMCQLTSSPYCGLGDFECTDRYAVTAYFDTTLIDEAAIRELVSILEK